MALRAVLAAALPLFGSAELQIHYYSDTLQTIEANGLAETPYSWPEVWATDSHNGDVDLCERLWYFDGDDLQLCCTESMRASVIEGCPAFGYGDMPALCGISNEDEYVCDGVGTTEVATYYIQYTAMDFSENTADPIDITVELVDTTKPDVPVPEYSGSDGDYVYAAEKCTYYDVPELTALDAVNLYLETQVAFRFFELGSEQVVFGNDHGMQSLESGVFCDGGTITDDVDIGVPGVYCISYGAVDHSGNVATPETIVVYVEDTTPPEVLLEIPATTIQCAALDGLPDPIPSASNKPCLDFPAAVLSYVLTDHPNFCEENNGDCPEVAAVTQHEGSYQIPYVANDGYNTATAWQKVDTVDTTAPEITCPNDLELRVKEEFYQGDVTATDACTTPTIEDNREVVKEDIVGTYTVTFTATDLARNQASCDQVVEIVDVYHPTCNVNGAEYVTVEACTGTYVETGATAQDNYDVDIQSKMTTTGTEGIDVNTPGVYTVDYNVCDAQALCADTCKRVVEVVDTVAPTISTSGELVMAQASEYSVGATAEAADTCGVDSVTWAVDAISFERCENFGFEVTSEYWVNVYGDQANEFVYYCGGSLSDAEEAATSAVGSEDIDNLAAACSAYEVTYTALDVNGLSSTAAQFVWVVDTNDPEIFSSYFFAKLVTQNSSTSGALLLAASALVAVVGVKAARKRRHQGYEAIPI